MGIIFFSSSNTGKAVVTDLGLSKEQEETTPLPATWKGQEAHSTAGGMSALQRQSLCGMYSCQGRISLVDMDSPATIASVTGQHEQPLSPGGSDSRPTVPSWL